MELLSQIAFLGVLVFVPVRAFQAIRWTTKREAARISAINSPGHWQTGVRNGLVAIVFGVAVILGAQTIWLIYLWVIIGSFFVALGAVWMVLCVKVFRDRKPATTSDDSQLISRRTENKKRAGIVFAISSLGWLICGIGAAVQ